MAALAAHTSTMSARRARCHDAWPAHPSAASPACPLSRIQTGQVATHQRAQCYSHRLSSAPASHPAVSPPALASRQCSSVTSGLSGHASGAAGRLGPGTSPPPRVRGPSPSAAAAAAAAATTGAAAGTVSGASGGAADGAATAPGWQLPADAALLFPAGEFSLELQVRDYELDQFNVVNNAVYASLFQHGRHEAFSALGHDVDEYARRGCPLALSQLNMTFRAPLRSRDLFRVTVSVDRVTAARLVIHQRIVKHRRGPGGAGGAGEVAAATAGAGAAAVSGVGGAGASSSTNGDGEELVAEAEAVVVFLDAAYRPARVPRDVARLFQAIADMKPK